MAGTETVPLLKQIRHVELRYPAVGDLFLWPSALPQDTAGRRGEARRERLPDGGTRGLPGPGLHHHEGRECHHCQHPYGDLTMLLLQAWDLDPDKRPSFTSARDSLEKFRIQNPQ